MRKNFYWKVKNWQINAQLIKYSHGSLSIWWKFKEFILRFRFSSCSLALLIIFWSGLFFLSLRSKSKRILLSVFFFRSEYFQATCRECSPNTTYLWKTFLKFQYKGFNIFHNPKAKKLILHYTSKGLI